VLVAAAAASFGACAQDAAERPSVTPYRPSVSTPAALSAPGWLEIEAGFTRTRGEGPVRRDSLPYTLKLAFSEDWGVRLGGDAWVRQRDAAGARRSGGGDTSVVLKRRFAVDADSAFGLEAGVNLPTARGGLGSDGTDWSVNGIYSADLGAWHTDLNLVATRLGRVGPGTSRSQLLWAASLSRALNDRWGVVGELSGTRQRGADGSAQLLAAASYNVSKSLTLDAGLSRSIRSGSDWSVFAGFTVLAARLF
jgi:hypothetical protein